MSHTEVAGRYRGVNVESLADQARPKLDRLEAAQDQLGIELADGQGCGDYGTTGGAYTPYRPIIRRGEGRSSSSCRDSTDRVPRSVAAPTPLCTIAPKMKSANPKPERTSNRQSAGSCSSRDPNAVTTPCPAVAPSECDQALSKAANFIADHFSPTEGWADFAFDKWGPSTSWTTAHVLWRACSILPEPVVGAAADLLLQRRDGDAAWGFNERTHPDSDSTIHAVRALLEVGVPDSDLRPSIEFVLAHQRNDGGFAAYNDAAGLARSRRAYQEHNYSGWTQSHPCVTAFVADTLSAFRSLAPARSLEGAINLLGVQQRPEGYWAAYWWRSRVFTTGLAVSVFLSKHDLAESHAVFSAVNWLLHQQLRTGAFSNGIDADSQYTLATAQAIIGLLHVEWARDAVGRAIEWLLRKQRIDGSWTSSPSLQVPPPHVMDPDEIVSWRTSGRGIGSCRADSQRLYTTAVCSHAVHLYATTLAVQS